MGSRTFVETGVSRRKFDAAVGVLEREREHLLHLGCIVWRTAYPEVDLIYLPRRVAGVPIQNGALMGLPQVAARPLGVRMSLDGYDFLPPSIEFRDPITWELLPLAALPAAATMEAGRAQRVLLAPHPSTGQPFLCLRGIREYHEHPQHDGDSWLLYRASISLLDTVRMISVVAMWHPIPVMLAGPLAGPDGALGVSIHWGWWWCSE